MSPFNTSVLLFCSDVILNRASTIGLAGVRCLCSKIVASLSTKSQVKSSAAFLSENML